MSNGQESGSPFAVHWTRGGKEICVAAVNMTKEAREELAKSAGVFFTAEQMRLMKISCLCAAGSAIRLLATASPEERMAILDEAAATNARGRQLAREVARG